MISNFKNIIVKIIELFKHIYFIIIRIILNLTLLLFFKKSVRSNNNSFFFNNGMFLVFFLNLTSDFFESQVNHSVSYYLSFNHYIFTSFSLQIFLFGLVGTAFNKRNFVSLLLSIEIMFLGLGLLFIGFSSLKFTLINFSLPLLILGISACETALGLSILIFMYKFGWQTDNFLFKNSQLNKNKIKNYITDNNYNSVIENGFNARTLTNHFLFFILTTSDNNINFFLMKNFDYLNVFFFWLTSFLFLSLLLFISRILSLYKPSRQKLSSYECGFEPFSDSRGKQDVLFYIVAILFILFDIELVFILPWAANHSFLPVSSYALIFFFIFTLVLGFAYEWRNGALSWVTK